MKAVAGHIKYQLFVLYNPLGKKLYGPCVFGFDY